MKRWRYSGAGLILVAVAVAIVLAALGRQTPPARAADVQIYLDYAPPPGALTSLNIPADCATWHELYPNWCVNHHQDGYEDGDGDGQISVCDFIILDGMRYHIAWVGPTYFLSCMGEDWVVEPEDPTGQDPTCEMWHEIYPNFCAPHHVDGWIDNGDGVVSPCDIVIVDGVECHIDDIGLDIIVVPDPTSTETSTWGSVKNLFRDLF